MASVLLVLFLFLAVTETHAGNLRSTGKAYFLSRNKTDPCYDETYISHREECIEPLVILYYGDSSLLYCPNIANLLPGLKCKGCLWDRINASAITPVMLRNLNRSELFHAAAPSCAVSQYFNDMPSFITNQYLNFFGFAIPLFSGMFLAKSDAHGSPTTPQVFQSRLK